MKFKYAAWLVLGLSFNAQAIDFDWKDCNSEINQFCKNENDNEKIWACLQKHDIDLSTPCDNAHSKYEMLTGKTKG